VRSLPEFLLVAVLVTLAPGPATAMILRVAARHGRRAAFATTAGNSVGVVVWAVLSAVGVSSLVAASQVAYDVLRIAGAAVLVWIGLRSLLRRDSQPGPEPGATLPGALPGAGPGAAGGHHQAAGWRLGLLTSVANPKLAVFFVALFPQFLRPGAAVLPAALMMAAVIVSFDLIWYSALALLVDRAGRVLRPRLHRALERFTGAMLIGFGVRLAAESR
jgi:threonine/homoserine/homoserine lactone efflux protein